MSTSDYEIHLKRSDYDSLWAGEDVGDFPFHEDRDDIDRICNEELGASRRRRRRGKKTPS